MQHQDNPAATLLRHLTNHMDLLRESDGVSYFMLSVDDKLRPMLEVISAFGEDDEPEMLEPDGDEEPNWVDLPITAVV